MHHEYYSYSKIKHPTMVLRISYTYRFLIKIFYLVLLATVSSHSFAAQPVEIKDTIKHEKVIQSATKNKLAKRSLKLTILGYISMMIPVIGIIGPFLIVGGIITAIMALNQISKTHQSGKTLAIISLVLGGIYMTLLVAALFILLSIFA